MLPLTVRLVVAVSPVKVGLAALAFRAKAARTAVEAGLLASDVLSTFCRPTVALPRPVSVPEKSGFTMLDPPVRNQKR